MGADESRLFQDLKDSRLMLDAQTVEETNEILGEGSYAQVKVVKVHGVRCASKNPHDVLTVRQTHSKNHVIQKFVDECERMGELRHPNIVQFLGIYQRNPLALPSLVMELLPKSLHMFLEEYVGEAIPDYIKYSIFTDVAQGLTYLHTLNPPVIHRDLSVNNILLTHSLNAKITDLGVSRTVSPPSLHAAHRMTKCPGIAVCMPPEAFDESPQYDTPLDIFSLGHTILHVVIQYWPTIYPKHRENALSLERVRLTEIERRPDMSKIDNQRLCVIVSNCLKDDPEERPTAKGVLVRLKQLSDAEPWPYSNLRIWQLIRQKNAMMKHKDAAIQQRDTRNEELKKRLHTRDVIIATLREELSIKDKYIEDLKQKKGNNHDEKENVRAIEPDLELQKQLVTKDENIKELKQKLSSKETAVENLKVQLAANDESIVELKQKLLSKVAPVENLKVQLQLANNKLAEIANQQKKQSTLKPKISPKPTIPKVKFPAVTSVPTSHSISKTIQIPKANLRKPTVEHIYELIPADTVKFEKRHTSEFQVDSQAKSPPPSIPPPNALKNIDSTSSISLASLPTISKSISNSKFKRKPLKCEPNTTARMQMDAASLNTHPPVQTKSCTLPRSSRKKAKSAQTEDVVVLEPKVKDMKEDHDEDSNLSFEEKKNLVQSLVKPKHRCMQ